MLPLLAKGQNAESQDGESRKKILKGGYFISFTEDDELQYLYLSKGDKTIKELSSTSKGLQRKNLGYVGVDFTDFFVLVHSFGSGNPHYIELIKKTDGENIINSGAAWIAADKDKELLLYCEVAVPSTSDRMTLLDIRTSKKEYFNFPTDILAESEVLSRIEISLITNNQIVFKYRTSSGLKTLKYYRQHGILCKEDAQN